MGTYFMFIETFCKHATHVVYIIQVFKYDKIQGYEIFEHLFIFTVYTITRNFIILLGSLQAT